MVGFFLALYLGVHKIYCVYNDIKQALVTSSPYFYISLICMVIGTQLFVAGFLAELLSRNSPERNKYQIEKVLS